jgi:hypothetical protein
MHRTGYQRPVRAKIVADEAEDGFCGARSALVILGMTDSLDQIER